MAQETVLAAKMALLEAAHDHAHATQQDKSVALVTASTMCLNAIRYTTAIVRAASRSGMVDVMDLLNTLSMRHDKEMP